MVDRWYYRVQGRQEGPCTFEELFQRVQSGEVSATDEVRNESSEQWVTVESIDGLLPQPETLEDLSELAFTFEENSPRRPSGDEGRPAEAASPDPADNAANQSTSLQEIADLSELSFEFVSEEPRPPRQRVTPIASVAGASTDAIDASGDSNEDEREWFCQTLGQELGPMSFEELMQLAENGTLQADDMVRRKSDGNWKPAADVPELSAALATSAPVEPSPQGSVTRPRSSFGKNQFLKDNAEAKTAAGPPSPQVAVAGNRGTASSPPAPTAAPSSDDEQSSENASDGDSPDHWYCRIDGVEHGPLAFEELQAMAKHGRLERWHGLKMSEKGDWIPAATIPELFGGAAPAAPTWDPEHQRQSSPLGPSAGLGDTRPVSTTYTPPPKPATSKSKPKRKKVRGPREPMFQNLGAQLAEHKTVLLGVLGMAVVAGLVFMFGFGEFGTSAETYYNQLNEIWQQHKALRKRNAPASEWEPLIKKAEQLQAEIVADLDDKEGRGRASAQTPALQQILWAGRDYLVDMLRECQREVGEKEERFARHMKAAHQIIEENKSQ